MKTSVLIRQALHSLRQNARRSILTMLGIIIGIAAVITIISLGKGFQRHTAKTLTQDDGGSVSTTFTFQPTNFDQDIQQIHPFNDRVFEEVKTIEGVDRMEMMSRDMPMEQFGSIKARKYDVSDMYALIKGSGPHVTVNHGRGITSLDNKRHHRVALVADHAAKEMYGTEENSLNKTVSIDGIDFTIIGTYSYGEPAMGLSFSFDSPSKIDPKNSVVNIPFDTYMRYLNQDAGSNLQATLYIKQGFSSKTVSEDVKNYLKANGPERNNGEYTYFDMSEILDGIGKTLDTLTYFVSSIAGISLVIAGVGVMNMMYISVSERIKEIGIRRALGATAKDIQNQFLIEGIALTVLGGMIGYILGITIAFVISQFLPFSIYPDAFTIILAISISVFIGVVFSVFPAKSAASKNVIDILR
ncbi:ABC transporter permease [Atopobacter phocae]|uniref:ABC transporter permease n=1 Tax=Atopobacter phocae TaxID=136492 RepID=UPI0004709152|nr:ABC transporter permease [Atopobacter phocae]